MTPNWKNIIIGLSSLLLFGLISEIALRLYFQSPKPTHFIRPNLDTNFNLSPGVMPGIFDNSQYKTNSLGVRGDALQEDCENMILAIGGSTTECLYLDQNEAWPQLVQNILQQKDTTCVWVGNIGKSGLSTPHYLAQLKYLVQHEELRKTSTILMLVGINDLMLFLADSSAYLSPFSSERESRAFFSKQPVVLQNIKWNQSALFTLAKRVYRRLSASQDRNNLIQDRAGEVYKTWRGFRRNAENMLDTLPNMGQALRVFENRLEAIIEVTQKNNMELYFMTQPVMWHAGMESALKELLWMGGVGKYQIECCSDYYTASALERGMNLFNERLTRTAKRNKIALIDLASKIPKDTSAFYDDCHFNESGASRVAQIVAKKIRL